MSVSPQVVVETGGNLNDHPPVAQRGGPGHFARWIKRTHKAAQDAGRIQTQVELARYLGVAETKVSLWFRGARLPNYRDLLRVCAFYEVDIREAIRAAGDDEFAWGGRLNAYNKANPRAISVDGDGATPLPTPKTEPEPPVDEEAVVEALDDLAGEIPGADRRRPLREVARRSDGTPDRRAK